MTEVKVRPFIKYIALKVDLFGSEIIDEKNFGINEEDEMMDFKNRYVRKDGCILVKVKL